jgi:hypothetical protein
MTRSLDNFFLVPDNFPAKGPQRRGLLNRAKGAIREEHFQVPGKVFNINLITAM